MPIAPGTAIIRNANGKNVGKCSRTGCGYKTPQGSRKVVEQKLFDHYNAKHAGLFQRMWG